MKQIQPIALTNDEALVLQQITENGEDDVIGLSHGLRMSRSRVAQQLEPTCGDLWVRASKRGRQLVRYMWPEMAPAY